MSEPETGGHSRSVLDACSPGLDQSHAVCNVTNFRSFILQAFRSRQKVSSSFGLFSLLSQRSFPWAPL